MSETSEKSESGCNRADREEELIKQVSQRPYLFDLRHPRYKYKKLKMFEWGKLGRIVGMTGDDAMKLWCSLKSQYTSYLRKRDGAPGLAAKSNTTFRHSEALAFYKKHYKPYKVGCAKSKNKALRSSPSKVEVEKSNEGQMYEEDPLNLGIPYCSEELEVPFQMSETLNPNSDFMTSTKRIKNDQHLRDEMYREVLATMNTKVKNDEFTLFGETVAEKLRKISLGINPMGATEMQMKILGLFVDFERNAINDGTRSNELGRRLLRYRLQKK